MNYSRKYLETTWYDNVVNFILILIMLTIKCSLNKNRNASLQLLEIILDYAIHTDDGILDPKLVTKIRLIQNTWLATTTKLLKKLEQPVIELKLTDKNSLNQNDAVMQKGKLLSRFIQTFTTGNSAVKYAIPFKLNLRAGFFWKENYDSLYDCLTSAGVLRC